MCAYYKSVSNLFCGHNLLQNEFARSSTDSYGALWMFEDVHGESLLDGENQYILLFFCQTESNPIQNLHIKIYVIDWSLQFEIQILKKMHEAKWIREFDATTVGDLLEFWKYLLARCRKCFIWSGISLILASLTGQTIAKLKA